MSHTPLSEADVLQRVNALKVDQRVTVVFRKSDKSKWATWQGVVVEARDASVDDPQNRETDCGDRHYAWVKYDQFKDVYALPQDGKRKMALIQYASIDVDEAEEWQTPKRKMLATTCPLPREAPREEMRLRSNDEGESDVSVVNPFYAFDPSKWHLILFEMTDALTLINFIKESFPVRYEGAGEKHAVLDILRGLQDGMQLAIRVPQITADPVWGRMQKRAINRMDMLCRRGHGAGGADLIALQQAFENSNLPEWMRSTQASAVAYKKLQTQNTKFLSSDRTANSTNVARQNTSRPNVARPPPKASTRPAPQSGNTQQQSN